MFSNLVDADARIYRFGILRHESHKPWKMNDNRLLNRASMEILTYAQNEYLDQIIIPIMDGPDPEIAKIFGVALHTVQGFVANGHDPRVISFKNVENIADPALSSGHYSVCTQCVDMVSYGFNCEDWIRQRGLANPYKTSIANEMKALEKLIKYSTVTPFIMPPVPEGCFPE